MTSYTNVGLVNGTTYYYKVHAQNSKGSGPFSTAVASTPLVIPSAPSLSGTVQNNGVVQLTWTQSAYADFYRVSRATSSSGPYADLSNVSGTSFFDVNVTVGTTYYYVVWALNSQASSPPSNSLPAFIPTSPPVLSAQAGNAKVFLSWTAPPTATIYILYAATSASGPFTAIANTNQTSVVHQNLVNGTTYYYYVKAYGSGGYSDPSAIASARPLSTLSLQGSAPSI